MTEVESSMNFFDHIKELRQKLIYVIIFFIIMFVLIFYTHRENIKRLINKEETKSKIY